MNARTWGAVAMLALGTLTVARCQGSGVGLSDADVTTLRGKAQHVMTTINAKDYAAWATDFADDAEWMPPNGPVVQKRAAIQAYIEAGPVMSGLVLTPVDIEGQGNLAYVRGNYTLNVAVPGAPAPIADKGKYMEIWRKQADGAWKNAKVMFNSDNPLPAPPAPPPAKKK